MIPTTGLDFMVRLHCVVSPFIRCPGFHVSLIIGCLNAFVSEVCVEHKGGVGGWGGGDLDHTRTRWRIGAC